MTLEELKIIISAETTGLKKQMNDAQKSVNQSVNQMNNKLQNIGKNSNVNLDLNKQINGELKKVKINKGSLSGISAGIATAVGSGVGMSVGASNLKDALEPLVKVREDAVQSANDIMNIQDEYCNQLDKEKAELEETKSIIYAKIQALEEEVEFYKNWSTALEDIIEAQASLADTLDTVNASIAENRKNYEKAVEIGNQAIMEQLEAAHSAEEQADAIKEAAEAQDKENEYLYEAGTLQEGLITRLARRLGLHESMMKSIKTSLTTADGLKSVFGGIKAEAGGIVSGIMSFLSALMAACPVLATILIVVAAIAIKFAILKAVIKAVVGVIKAFGKVCATAVKVVWKLSLLGPAFKLLGNAIKKVGSTIKDAITSPLKDALSDFGSTISSMISKSSGVQSALSGLKGSFLVAFQPILNLVVPALTVLINALSSVCMWVAKLGAMLSGKTLGALKADAQAAYGVAEGMDAAGAAAEDANNTMGIDELNVISQDSGGGGSSANSIIPDFSGIGGEGFTSFADSFNNLLDNLIAGLPTLSSLLLGASDSINNFFTNLYDGLTNADVTEKVKTLAAGLATSINDFIANTDWTLIGKTIGAGLNRAVDFVSTFFETFDWAGWAKSFTDSINGFIQEVDWANVGKMLFEGVHGALVFCIEFIKGIDWQAIGQALADLIKGIDWWTLIKDIFSLLWEIVKATFSLIWGLIVGLIIEPIVALFNDIKTKVTAKMAELKIKLVEIWTSIKTVVIDKVTQLKNKVNEIWTIVKTWVVEKATKIKEDVSTAFTNMKKTVIDVFDAIKNGIKTPINGIIRFINKMISGICDGVNAVVDALNTIEVSLPDWDILGEYAGASLGLNLNHVVPFQIPELAKGGIVNSGQLFMANENGPELVGRYGNQTGVMNNDQIVSAVSTGVFNAMMEAMKNGSQAVNVFLDGKQIEASVRGTAQSRGAIIANGGVLNYAY